MGHQGAPDRDVEGIRLLDILVGIDFDWEVADGIVVDVGERDIGQLVDG